MLTRIEQSVLFLLPDSCKKFIHLSQPSRLKAFLLKHLDLGWQFYFDANLPKFAVSKDLNIFL